MARGGRKRKPGKRTESGRLARVKVEEQYCAQLQRLEAMGRLPAVNRALWLAGRAREAIRGTRSGRKDMTIGPHVPPLGEISMIQSYDAIGRAWAAGLLGSGERSTILRDTARIVAAQYWRVYGFSTPDSLARFQPVHGVGIPDPEKDRIREDALNDSLEAIRKISYDVRVAFDQLVIDMNPDSGPAWLDRIIAAHRSGRGAAERDTNMLRLAVKGLNELA